MPKELKEQTSRNRLVKDGNPAIEKNDDGMRQGVREMENGAWQARVNYAEILISGKRLDEKPERRILRRAYRNAFTQKKINRKNLEIEDVRRKTTRQLKRKCHGE